MALAIWICLGLDIDQKSRNTILEGQLPEREYVYMTCPEGMDLEEDECLEIRKGMYGLVQAARVYWMKMCKFLVEKVGFYQSKQDQCLL